MQVVGYDRAGAADETAALLVADSGSVREEPLEPGRELAYTLRDRHCAGALDGDSHGPCDAEAAPRCPAHRSRWPCARCTGNCDMPLDDCHEEHAVYLAAFAPDAFKVGVTKSWRLERRLREQGADRAAHVRTVKDGKIARQLEADLAEEIPDRVRIPRKVRGLAAALDESAWEALLSDFEVLERFAFDYGLELSHRPMAETLASGTVVGTKGRILVLERGGDRYAVDLRDLVGHDLDAGAPDRGRQSSLGTFE